jgi:uncharacterized protein YdhG (YjbR/CyaY superfamily)
MQPGQAPQTIDQYIAACEPRVRPILRKLRATIRQAAPSAREAIKYRIPTVTLHGNLVHFAAFKRHIGFFPTPRAIDAFREELSAYELSKGTVRFPLDKPIPHRLIARMVKLRVKQDAAKAKAKRKKRRTKT